MPFAGGEECTTSPATPAHVATLRPSWDYLWAMELIDRLAERSLLDEVLRDMRSGERRVLVLLGCPGIGKSALLEYLAGRHCRRPAGQICLGGDVQHGRAG
jgi:ABC-type transporter Mla maintaining outer membrane lipid asymmetry ATPase subunit MlaF